MAFTLLDYSFDVSKRLSNQHACRWDLVENPKNSPYVARYCQLTKDTVVLRLYDAKEENLLAERIYFEENVALVVWTPTELLYRNSTGDVILLPPTLIDRLRAKFP
ncbi:MAG: hypothetical protein V4636_02370 [Pseudomonadota bacterium]